jgi:hypothetical protein
MAERTPLTSAEVELMAAEYPSMPPAYFEYLRDFGWGLAPSGHLIYSAPISPNEVHSQLSGDRERVLIGDDMQGYCLGYDFVSTRFGEFSEGGVWSYFDDRFDLKAYLNTKIA